MNLYCENNHRTVVVGRKINHLKKHYWIRITNCTQTVGGHVNLPNTLQPVAMMINLFDRLASRINGNFSTAENYGNLPSTFGLLWKYDLRILTFLLFSRSANKFRLIDRNYFLIQRPLLFKLVETHTLYFFDRTYEQ